MKPEEQPINGEPAATALTPMEMSIRENLPPPGYDVVQVEDRSPQIQIPGRAITPPARSWGFVFADAPGGGIVVSPSRRRTCRAAWRHFEIHGPGALK